MTELTTRTAELRYNPDAVAGAVALWADARTDAGSARRHDLLRDKCHVVNDFFDFTGKHPVHVTFLDVKAWQVKLESQEPAPAPATIYASISRVSSFYTWLMLDPDLARAIRTNPVDLARPKAPKAYQNESVQALDDEEMQALVRVVKDKADTGNIVGKRDLALLLFHLLTGLRRREVAQLRWGDVKINGTITLTCEVKGGDYESREVAEPAVRDALVDYLEASGRLDGMTEDSPLWTRHDRAGKPGGPLTSHAFAKNLKGYARQAGIGNVHVHQLRHTFARIVAEESGSLAVVQEALGHKNPATTRVYVRRLAVKRDVTSAMIAGRLGL